MTGGGGGGDTNTKRSLALFTCVRALVCFEVGALGVDLPASVEVTPVHPPPPVGRSLSAGQSRPVHGPLRAPSPYFPRRVQHSLYPAPHLGDRAVFGQLGGRRRGGDDGGAQVFPSVAQNVTQGIGGEVEGGGELLGAVRSLAAGVGVETAGVEVLAFLIVFLLLDVGDLWVRLARLVPAGEHQLAPQVLLALKLEVGGGDVGLALEVPLQLQARLCWREEMR